VGCEGFGIPYFLKKYNIPFTDRTDEIVSFISKQDSCYFVTSKPNSFEEYEGYNFEILADKLTYHTLVKVTKK
jgi:hypothetical protein